MSLHYLVALAFQTLVPLVEVSSSSKVDYSDVANRYVSLKYSNGYLRFWDDVYGRSDLRAEKLHGIHSDSKAFDFFNKKRKHGDTWNNLVSFCRNMRKEIEKGGKLNNGQLRYIGFCDKDNLVPRSKDMNTRSYWIDQLVRVKYNLGDFAFWDKFSENTGERMSKFYDLIVHGYEGGLSEVLGKAKSECQLVRSKFDSGEKFTEEDLETKIPRCLSSLRTR
ncbi:hypothetical protein MHC_05040 [Mycoplasma haemocanis str. Illinois]|uniref:Uncharacterized protein n=1 Tax=Mycoplasma haemocanis (strain Illinois) TaxID=1111676 RepID=H6N892_MYCHN|nr:hypothetical protein [Mycoplasma haemocanis]AEW45864.1 hypothetical protein MHC_05040 [Mycoplasma haemocanis str. Illinois]